LQVDILLAHVALNQEVVLDVLHNLDLFNQVVLLSLLVSTR
jgi:hypothetical protein